MVYVERSDDDNDDDDDDAGVTRVESLQQLVTSSDCITLHCCRTQRNARPVINQCTLRQMRRGTLNATRQLHSSPVSIQTQSLALRALRKRKPQETQALALANFTEQTQAPANRNARSKQWQP